MNIQETKRENLTYYTLQNDAGAELTVVDYGARLISFKVPVGNEARELVVSGGTKKDFDNDSKYFGATIGRVAGRITKGQFTLNGEKYQIDRNEGENTLHGGGDSFEFKFFAATTTTNEDSCSVTFSLVSPAGEKGFPGELKMSVTYTLLGDNTFTVSYEGTTDASTLFNPTNHGYFNLNGVGADISQHTLQISADRYGVLKDDSMPTGELRPVKGTAFDFQAGKKLAVAFDSDDEQIAMKRGIDHPFVFTPNEKRVVLTAPDESISLEITTDRDAIVVFTSNFAEVPSFEEGQVAFHGAVALETQNIPDAINHQGFGDIVLTPAKPFASTTTYHVTVK